MTRSGIGRLFRISLRMAFVLMTILCVLLGFKVHRVTEQKEAVAWVENRNTSGTRTLHFDRFSDNFGCLSQPAVYECLEIPSGIQ